MRQPLVSLWIASASEMCLLPNPCSPPCPKKPKKPPYRNAHLCKLHPQDLGDGTQGIRLRYVSQGEKGRCLVDPLLTTALYALSLRSSHRPPCAVRMLQVDAIAASLLMLSGAVNADPVLLQRIATKKASTDDVQAAVLRGGGTPTHILRARDERTADSPRQL